jgi:hypothetical protein
MKTLSADTFHHPIKESDRVVRSLRRCLLQEPFGFPIAIRLSSGQVQRRYLCQRWSYDSDLAEIVMVSSADVVVEPSEVPVVSSMMLFVLLGLVWLH